MHVSVPLALRETCAKLQVTLFVQAFLPESLATILCQDSGVEETSQSKESSEVQDILRG